MASPRQVLLFPPDSPNGGRSPKSPLSRTSGYGSTLTDETPSSPRSPWKKLRKQMDIGVQDEEFCFAFDPLRVSSLAKNIELLAAVNLSALALAMTRIAMPNEETTLIIIAKDEEEKEAFASALQKKNKTLESISNTMDREERLRQKDGSYKWILNDNDEQSKLDRMVVTQDTLMAAWGGGYIYQGKAVILRHVSYLEKNTFICHGTPEKPLKKMQPDSSAQGKSGSSSPETKVLFLPGCQVMGVALQCARAGRKVCAVNAASPYHCGGGSLTGGRHAMEESWCNQSSLLLGLRKVTIEGYGGPDKYFSDTAWEMKSKQHAYGLHIPEDACVIAPLVEVFREEWQTGYEFVAGPGVLQGVASVGFYNKNPSVTDAPVDAPTDKNEYKEGLRKKLYAVMKGAVLIKSEVLVIPDCGSGVYKNDPSEVGEIFGEVLKECFGCIKSIIVCGNLKFTAAVEKAANLPKSCTFGRDGADPKVVVATFLESLGEVKSFVDYDRVDDMELATTLFRASKIYSNDEAAMLGFTSSTNPTNSRSFLDIARQDQQIGTCRTSSIIQGRKKHSGKRHMFSKTKEFAKTNSDKTKEFMKMEKTKKLIKQKTEKIKNKLNFSLGHSPVRENGDTSRMTITEDEKVENVQKADEEKTAAQKQEVNLKDAIGKRNTNKLEKQGSLNPAATIIGTMNSSLTPATTDSGFASASPSSASPTKRGFLCFGVSKRKEPEVMSPNAISQQEATLLGTQTPSSQATELTNFSNTPTSQRTSLGKGKKKTVLVVTSPNSDSRPDYLSGLISPRGPDALASVKEESPRTAAGTPTSSQQRKSNFFGIRKSDKPSSSLSPSPIRPEFAPKSRVEKESSVLVEEKRVLFLRTPSQDRKSSQSNRKNSMESKSRARWWSNFTDDGGDRKSTGFARTGVATNGSKKSKIEKDFATKSFGTGSARLSVDTATAKKSVYSSSSALTKGTTPGKGRTQENHSQDDHAPNADGKPMRTSYESGKGKGRASDHAPNADGNRVRTSHHSGKGKGRPSEETNTTSSWEPKNAPNADGNRVRTSHQSGKGKGRPSEETNTTSSWEPKSSARASSAPIAPTHAVVKKSVEKIEIPRESAVANRFSTLTKGTNYTRAKGGAKGHRASHETNMTKGTNYTKGKRGAKGSRASHDSGQEAAAKTVVYSEPQSPAVASSPPVTSSSAVPKAKLPQAPIKPQQLSKYLALYDVKDVNQDIVLKPKNARDRNLAHKPLHQAIEDERPDIVVALIAAGADKEALNKIGQTPIAFIRKNMMQSPVKGELFEALRH